ncbi:hypothetical protein CPS_0097 [Colwellia psychrerythraea 34H]|uniref:(S)-ureidoglycine aminohydrolase cupin domain-containing protein n=2 Tax=Colwellia psychrerythraea TaxID=28229 RepID=Q48AP8_COLP3|nr:hypothetical protein CPS_0097 [Colwellia psychrerythraea 34H]
MSNQKIIRLSPNPQDFGHDCDDLDPQMFASELPVQHTHVYYEDDNLGLYIGVWDTSTMVEAAAPSPCDEFMYLLEGEVEIKNSKTGTMEKVQAGEAFVIPKGYDCQWHQTGYLRKFFVISEHPKEDIPTTPVVEGIIKLKVNNSSQMAIEDSTGVEIEPTNTPFVIKGKEPAQKHLPSYKDHTGKFIAGTWHSEAFNSEMQPFPRNEFIYLQSGSLVITEQEGDEQVFTAGDAFFVPQGALCSWRSIGDVHTFYAILQSS